MLYSRESKSIRDEINKQRFRLVDNILKSMEEQKRDKEGKFSIKYPVNEKGEKQGKVIKLTFVNC